jgi:hypothetical protein
MFIASAARATPDDAEAVANIEKLTGTKIERVGGITKAAPREEAEQASEKPKRTSRAKAAPKPPAKAEPKAEPAPRPERAPRPAPAARQQSRPQPEDDQDDGGWNGPMPGFLGVKLGS